MKGLLFTLLLVTGVLIVMACKSARLGPEYPIKDFSAYDCVVVAQVDKATHETVGYHPLKTFDATISMSLKGNLEIGQKISGKAKKEESRAVCPVHLDEGAEYLLLLTKSVKGYRLSRFSFPVKKGYSYFDDYLKQIEKSLSENNRN